LAPAVDGGDDFVGIGSPDEWLGIMIGLGNEPVDGGLEIDGRSEDSALEVAPGEFAKNPSTSRPVTSSHLMSGRYRFSVESGHPLFFAGCRRRVQARQ
jgi:hypothetical protein